MAVSPSLRGCHQHHLKTHSHREAIFAIHWRSFVVYQLQVTSRWHLPSLAASITPQDHAYFVYGFVVFQTVQAAPVYSLFGFELAQSSFPAAAEA